MALRRKKLPLRGHLLSRAGFRLWRIYDALDASHAVAERGTGTLRERLTTMRDERLADLGGRDEKGRPRWASSASNEKRVAGAVPVDRKNIKKALFAVGIPRKNIRIGRCYVPAVPELEDVRIGDVPLPDGPMFGREREAADVAWRAQAGVLYLVGVPGIGKSHLARDVGSRLAGKEHQLYPGGVWYVDVHGVVDAADETALHQCLAITLEQIRMQGSGRSLLIVDGADGLAASCSYLLQFCREASEVCLLITARTAPRNVPHYRLGALRVSAGDADAAEASLAQRLARSPAVRLYVERVRRWQPTFAVTPEVAGQIYDECTACHGVPAQLIARADVAIKVLTDKPDPKMLLSGYYVPRESEERAILSYLAQHRAQINPPFGLLLSVEGDGGMGKTRLMREAWARHVPSETEVRVWVDFTQAFAAGMDHAGSEEFLYEAFLRHLAMAFPLLPSHDPATTVLTYLRGKAGILVFDNLETVQCTFVEDFLRRLRRDCPRLCVLCTTRLSLAKITQAVIDLNGGMTPNEAVRLFLKRWREACSPAGEFQAINQADVLAIVDVSGRIPLAVELIAAVGRADTPPALLAAELTAMRAEAANSAAFLERFADPDSAAARRWSSVEASMLWSYRHIRRWVGAQHGAAVEHAFVLCGTFAGPFLDEDFAAVDGLAGVRHLEALHAAHLIDRDPETGAWRQHVFLHEFTRKLLNALPDAAALRDRHADHYWRQFRTNAEDLAVRQGGVARIAFAEPNWTQAGYTLLHRAAAGDEIAARTFRESRAALHKYVWFGCWIPQLFLGEAAKLCRRYRDQAAEAHCISGIAVSLSQRGLHDAAEPVWQEAARLYQAAGDRARWANAVRVLASIAQERGQLEEACIGYREAIRLHGDERSDVALYCFRDLAGIASREGRLDEAEAGFKTTMKGFADLKLRNNVADCVIGLAEVCQKRGDFLTERRLYKQALREFRKVDDTFGIHGCFWRLSDAGTRATEAAGKQGRRLRALREAKLALARIETARVMNQRFCNPYVADLIAARSQRVKVVLSAMDVTT